MSNSQRSTASLRIETLTDFYADLFLNVSEPVRMLVFYLYSDEELNAGWLDAYGAEGEIRDFQFVTDGHGNYAAYSRSGTSLPAGEYILTRINWSHDGDNAGFAGVQLVNVVAESGLDLVLEQSSQVWYDPANQNQHTYKIKRDNELIQENWIGYQFTDQGCSFPQVCCYRIATVAGGLTSIYSAEICESPYLLTGCTDPGAQNYNPVADQDDLSCLYDFEISEPAQLFNINPHPEAEMGTSVSNDGDYAIAGAPGAEDNSSLAGSAFTYRKITSGSDSYWITEGELIPSYSHINDDFGQAVAVSGSLALVSAPAFDPGGMSASGVVYAFERINGSWQETAQISGSNTDFSDYFGSAIDLDNQTAVIGGYNIDIPEINSGGVYFFELINETWIETAFFTCPTPDQEDQFGYSVSVDGDVAVVSARRDLEGSNEFGSAFVYTRVSGEWVFRQRLEPVSNTAGRIFGESVAVQDSLILVGAANNGIDPSAKGKGILFAFEDGQWEETAVFTAPDGQVQDDFARSVAFENNLIAIGAPFNFDAPESLSGNGSVYLYGFNDGSWRSLSRISAFNGSIMDRFGSSVSISGTTILAGAPGWDNPASNSGSAYVTEFEWNEFHYGCTDQLALNYNPEANLDDGSCLYFDVNFNLVPQQFPTIQEAITYSINGDTILVAPGEYMESINFLGKSLYITSHYFFTLSDESISQTIINGHYDEPVVTFDNGENNSSVLSGFTVEHGGHRVFDYDENGFTENYGGGVFCLHSSPRLEKLVLRANLTSSGSKKGGGITCLDSHPIISDVIIEDNQGYMGSGIYMLDSSPVITNCIMRKNTGGIYCGNSHPVINGIDFIDNEDDKGSALYSDDHSHPIIQNAVFRDNRSWDHGGAVYLDHAALTLRYADIYENSARYGGAFYLIDSSHVHLSQVDIHDNSADYATGGINAYNSFVYLDTVQVRSNDGANYGGGISLTNSELTLNAVSLTNNRAISGGGIYLKWDWAIHTEGEGAIAIYNNQAEWGRDFYQDYYSFDTLTMEIDTFSVDQANAYHAWPDGRYELSIGHGQLQTIDQDLFVSPNGDDANEGTSWSSPLATISAAMERIRPPADSVLTVFLDSGTIPIYREDDTYSLICDPGVSIAGFHRDSTIVIGEDSQRLTYKYSYGTELRDFTLSGPAGPGMTIYGSEMDVHDLAVRNISSGTGIT
ncbi:MAG: hypothetical protein H8D46_02370, partial [FCB group bacterium]|nr:hypothetical protein [FCB group bacterium]